LRGVVGDDDLAADAGLLDRRQRRDDALLDVLLLVEAGDDHADEDGVLCGLRLDGRELLDRAHGCVAPRGGACSKKRGAAAKVTKLRRPEDSGGHGRNRGTWTSAPHCRACASAWPTTASTPSRSAAPSVGIAAWPSGWRRAENNAPTHPRGP